MTGASANSNFRCLVFRPVARPRVDGVSVGPKAGELGSWYGTTVPQHARDEEFFAPLGVIEPRAGTMIGLGVVPYNPDKQEPDQVPRLLRLHIENMGRYAKLAE